MMQTLQMRRGQPNYVRTTTTRSSMVAAVGTILVLFVAGCSSDEQGGSSSNTLAPPSTTTTVVVTTLPPSTITTQTITTPTIATTIPPPATATTTPETTTTVAPTTTTTVPLGSYLSLRGDGLGDADFGADPDEVLPYMTFILKPADDDSGWVDAVSRTCPGTEVRLVRWGDLTLYFGDDSAVASGRRHFFAWSFGPATEVEPSPAGLFTPEGVGIGSTVKAIGRAYPNAILFEGDDVQTASAQINPDLFAFITDAGDSGVITAMLGGQGCGE